MPANFDQFPIYDPLIKDGTNKMSDVWVNSITTFFQTLITYLTQNGIFPPQLTTDQRDSIQTPVNGQTIYNTTIGSNQYFKAGTWVSY